jgi:hypothetical protein
MCTSQHSCVDLNFPFFFCKLLDALFIPEPESVNNKSLTGMGVGSSRCIFRIARCPPVCEMHPWEARVEVTATVLTSFPAPIMPQCHRLRPKCSVFLALENELRDAACPLQMPASIFLVFLLPDLREGLPECCFGG